MRPPRPIVLPPLLLGLALAAVACAPEAATQQGAEINRLYDFFTWVAIFIFVIVVGLISWSIARYRRRGADELPDQFHTNVRLELVWFAVPQVIVVVLFVLTFLTHQDVNEQSEPSVRVDVEGFQWGWRFSYEGEGVEVTSTSERPRELVLPVGRRIAFNLSSADVIHSFYVPRFLMKRDAIPGKPNRFDVTIEDEGSYRGACAEFCGLLHEEMNFTVRAVPDREFRGWLTRQGASDGGA